MTRRTIICGAVVLGALSLLLPRRPVAISLMEQRVHLQAAPDDVFRTLSTLNDGPRILERTAEQVIAEFPVRLGWYQVTTLERVRLNSAKRTVTFEQLRSPFFSVRGATEVFALAPTGAGGTELTLRGFVWPRLGAFGWLITRIVVRPRWDRIEARFLETIRQRLPAGGA